MKIDFAQNPALTADRIYKECAVGQGEGLDKLNARIEELDARIDDPDMVDGQVATLIKVRNHLVSLLSLAMESEANRLRRDSADEQLREAAKHNFAKAEAKCVTKSADQPSRGAVGSSSMKAMADQVLGAIKLLISARLKPIDERLKTLEDRIVKAGDVRYRGTYKDGTDYVKGNFATWDGGVWACMADTSARPGAGNTDWQLAVKGTR